MTNKTKFKIAVLEAGLTMKWVAMELGITPAGLYKKINNYSEFRASELEKLRVLLNLCPERFGEIFFATNVDYKSTIRKGVL